MQFRYDKNIDQISNAEGVVPLFSGGDEINLNLYFVEGCCARRFINVQYHSSGNHNSECIRGTHQIEQSEECSFEGNQEFISTSLQYQPFDSVEMNNVSKMGTITADKSNLLKSQKVKNECSPRRASSLFKPKINLNKHKKIAKNTQQIHKVPSRYQNPTFDHLDR